FRWLIAPNTDHRIPFMKAMQYTALRLSGFDFRALLALNVAIAAGASMAFVCVARRFRGRSHIGDLIIPMLLLNFGFGFSQWGFSGQFLLAVAASLIFLFLLGEAVNRDSPLLNILAFVSLMICAFTGLNGVILASVISICLLAAALLVK